MSYFLLKYNNDESWRIFLANKDHQSILSKVFLIIFSNGSQLALLILSGITMQDILVPYLDRPYLTVK